MTSRSNIVCQLVSPEFYRVSDLLTIFETQCGFRESELAANSGWRVVDAALTAGEREFWRHERGLQDWCGWECAERGVDVGLSEHCHRLAARTDQTAFNLGTTVGLVAASDVSGSGAPANGAECVYSDMGLGAEYSIVDCRSVGMNDLGTECAGAVRALNDGK